MADTLEPLRTVEHAGERRSKLLVVLNNGNGDFSRHAAIVPSPRAVRQTATGAIGAVVRSAGVLTGRNGQTASGKRLFGNVAKLMLFEVRPTLSVDPGLTHLAAFYNVPESN